MVDCPCGYGKDIPEGQQTCPICGIDVRALHRIKALPRILYEEGTDLVGHGRVNEGVKKFAAAVALGVPSAGAYKALGDAYSMQGLYEQANFEYEQGLKISPEDSNLRSAQEAVAQIQSKNAAIRLHETKQLESLRNALVFVCLLAFLAVGGTFTFWLVFHSAHRRPVLSYPQLASQLRQDFRSDPLLKDSRLDVTAQDRKIRITGRVPSEAHRRLALEIAMRKAGDQAEITSGLEVEQPPEVRQGPYTVRAGDTLGKLAERFYGDSRMWPKLYEANRVKLSSPNKLTVNQVLVVPK